jgi:hypothetical protein
MNERRAATRGRLKDIDFHFHLGPDLPIWPARPMSDRLIDIRTQLAASPRTRVEIGQDGVLHVLAGPITLHLDRAVCEELTTTLARAMVALARSKPSRRNTGLRLVREADGETSDEPDAAPLAARAIVVDAYENEI